MILIQPVLEIYVPDDFALWPVAALAPFSLLALGGGLSPEEVGSVMASLGHINRDTSDDAEPVGDPLDLFLGALLDPEDVTGSGGLRIEDTVTGTVLRPGCCCDLNDWREWLELGADGIWLGHDPWPVAERLGDTVRLVPDQGNPGPVIELPAAELGRLLRGVQRDLAGLLRLVDGWAGAVAPGRAPALLRTIDTALKITPAVAPDHAAG
ncbi:hypothetical protein [Kitasatospora sp. NPDC050543]|uniref:hypothetical protein n=1 Tax=Kitasatospora sp. NPDC050543 TaxID=3364054 RepID=UPI0037B6CA9A